MKNQYRMQSRPTALLALLLALGLLLPARLLAQSGLTLTLPTYNCATGAITFNVTGSDGTPITYQAPGIIRASVTSNTGTIEQGLRNDPKPITITATQSGKTASFTFDFAAYCASLNTKSPDIDPLVDLYNATNGANWKNKTNWLVGNSPCNWYGITCGADGRVTSVAFYEPNNLDGTLPATLGNLSRLETFFVFIEPGLKGTIPASVSQLSQLKTLEIEYASLTGEIPVSLGSLTQLENLFLGSNKLTGSIPASLGNLSKLQYLHLFSNQLTGSIPASLGNLSQLKSLFVAANQLSGCLPPALSSLCGKDVNISSNPGLPNGGDWANFCSFKSGVCTTTGPLTVLLPTYDCATGVITFNTSGGDGSPITYQAPGIIRASVTSNTGTIDAPLRADPKPITIMATQSGKTASYTFDFKAFCANANPDLQPLIDLYNATSGPSWTRKDNWLTGSNPCNWQGVSCNTAGRVNALLLSGNNLNGSIPASLGTVSQLLFIDFGINGLKGAIPASLGNLSQLQLLFLSENQLTGSIPDALGNLSELQGLIFRQNQLTGSIPTSLGNLSKLTRLDLNTNQLNGSIPTSLGNLSQMNYLSLSSNQLTGSIPTSLGNLSKLQELRLSFNNLTGTIPVGLGSLSQLTNLALNANYLTGSIPATLGNLSQLTSLYLYANQLTGSIPASLGSLSKLQTLQLYYNQLSGCIPSALSTLCGKDVSIFGNPGLPGGGNFAAFCNNRTGSCDNPLVLTAPTYNCATGAITFNTTGGDFTPITYFAAGIIRSSPTSNTGIVEQGLRNDPKVLVIQATQSGKTVSINFDFGSFCANASPDYGPLVDLYNATKGDSWYSKSNWLTGNNPCNWYGVGCTDGRVTNVRLGYNNLNGTLPASLGSLSQLQSLNLSNNTLTGPIPASLGNLSQLQTLDLSYTQLNGAIPVSMGNLIKLQYLYLYDNQLTGEIPASLGNLAQLVYFYATNNRLSGSIPASLWNLPRLQFLYLGNNQLTGEIPMSTGNLSELVEFSAYNNRVNGSIPSSLANLSKLRFLDLSTNQLVGEIPSSIGNLSSIRNLFLANNQLTGSVPASFANFSQNLTYIYLNNNKLSGCLPAALSKLCGRGYVDLSGNVGLPGGGNFSAFCSTGAGACLPEPLVLTTPTYVCATGAITFNTTGGDGSPITYFAAGIIRTGPSSNTGIVEAGLRGDPKVLVIQATQSGKTVSINFDFGAYCRSLNAVGEPGTRLSVEVLGNPVREQVQVLIRGAEGRSVQLRLTDVTGRVLETRTVDEAGASEEQTFRLSPGQAPGVLLLQAATTQQTQTVKIVKY